MLRIAFARKNKTLSAEFKNKKVVEILEKNYRTHCSVNNQPIGMDFDMVNLIDESLKDNDMNEKRARQMDIGIGYIKNHPYNRNIGVNIKLVGCDICAPGIKAFLDWSELEECALRIKSHP